MKSEFKGYFKLTERQLENLWESCIFIFDANVLLNLYRYSEAAQEDFISVLNQIEDRIWLPHQVVNEFLKKSVSVISEQGKNYQDVLKGITKLEGDLDNSRMHPFVSDETLQETKRLFEKLRDELRDNHDSHLSRISNDEIKERLASIYTDDKVGSSFSEEAIKDILAEGAKRYATKTPPGYMDADKGGNDESVLSQDTLIAKYGDYIIWEQVKEYAKEQGVNIIFVTDDNKDDWWLKSGNKVVGPRPELIEEFVSEVEKEFYMYSTVTFLRHYKGLYDEASTDSILKEVQDISDTNKANLDVSKDDVYDVYKNIREAQLSDASLNEYINSMISNKNISHFDSIQDAITKYDDAPYSNLDKVTNNVKKLFIDNDSVDLDKALEYLNLIDKREKYEVHASKDEIKKIKLLTKLGVFKDKGHLE